MSADHGERVAAPVRPGAIGTGFSQSRERILDAATILFAEHGFQATTIRDLANRAGVNIAAVNYHFGSKEELHTRVIDNALSRWSAELAGVGEQEVGQLVPPSLDRILRAIIEALIAPVFERQDGAVIVRLLAWGLLENPPKSGEGRVTSFALVLAQLLDPYLDVEAGAPDSLLFAQWLVGQCLLLSMPMWPNEPSRDAMINTIVNLAMHGLASQLQR
jgi:AcrR family transcriptional regulator